MNTEQLNALKKRAERATEVATEIEQLSAASVRTGSRKFTYVEWNTNNDVLPSGLLKEVIEAGRLKLLADKERELNELLGAEQKVDPLESVSVNAVEFCCESMEKYGRCGA